MLDLNQVRNIAIEEIMRLNKGAKLMTEVKVGITEVAIKYNAGKMEQLILNDKFLFHISQTKNADHEILFYTYVVGDSTLEKKYQKLT